jgi:hypothetical protein
MSNLSVNTITDALGGSTASINGLTPQASNMQPFNRIINGAMTIDQRNAGASVTQTAGVTYTVDRWAAYGNQASKFTVQQNAGSVTPPTGFTNYLGVTSSSAYTVGSGDGFWIRQPIEGANIADFGWGTANAKTVTLSFWVRSSLTGAFGGAILDNFTPLSYPFSYTIATANTWEQKTITITGPTSGSFPTGNTAGLYLLIGLGNGATLSGTAGAWTAANLQNVTGATSVVGTSGATFYITGVQLEAGSTASPFAHEFVGDTLRKCQRYYWQLPPSSSYTASMPMIGAGQAWSSTNAANFTATFPVTMRASPTLFQSGLKIYSPNIGARTASITLQSSTAANGANLHISGASAMSGGQMWYIVGSANATDYIGFGAEL